ncbi:M48 family metallopeptidase [Modicisalibacter xianhensis]|uniref:Heat shock protein HtpX n=1 Tax=Modicisalibacter xianhensis TaxID=442341 RepID=A0A1I3FPV9_9GAMM|nr:M48 family metallopeptidase [Halomonas xianhensis]SFI13157.1 heat shock protein HtpX [Halomonas xianhensis]
MLALLSAVSACLAGGLGFTVMVVLPVVVFIGVPMEFMRPPGEPMTVTLLAQGTFFAGGVLTALAWLGMRLAPASYRIGRLFPGAREIADHVWVYETHALQAYAMPSPTGGVVIVSRAALNLPADELHWLLAHERSHLRRGDASANLCWWTQHSIMRVALWLARLIHTILRPIPLVGLLSGLYFSVASFGLSLALGLFKVMDRHLGRLMEYRADRDAARVTTPMAGCRLLSRLSAGLEPSWGLFSTHPPTYRRIKRLERMT